MENNQNNTQANDEWESTKGSGNTWNPKNDSKNLPKATPDVPFEAPNDPENILIGYVVDRRDGIGKHGSSVITVLEKETNQKKDVWLDTVLEKEIEKVPMNVLVKIQWLGTKLKKDMKPRQKGATFHIWDVKFKSNDVYKGEAASAPKTEKQVQKNEVNAGKKADPAHASQDKRVANMDSSPLDNDDLPF